MGDSWSGPTVKAVISSDGNRIVRVEPGESIGYTVGFAGEPKGSFALATYYERAPVADAYQPYLQISLQNPVAPVDILLSDSGILVTLDNWHNMGYGFVVVIFDKDGKIVKSYKLEDLYTEENIAKISHSVSSRWWRCATSEPRIQSDSLRVTDTIGGEFMFDLHDGSFDYSQQHLTCPKI
jgi:hypothetical protein